MALALAAYIGPPQPLKLFYPQGIHSALKTTGAGIVHWASDDAEDVIPANHDIPTHDGAGRFDNRNYVWVVVAFKGSDAMKLYKELDLLTISASGDYARLFRITNRVEYFQQV